MYAKPAAELLLFSNIPLFGERHSSLAVRADRAGSKLKADGFIYGFGKRYVPQCRPAVFLLFPGRKSNAPKWSGNKIDPMGKITKENLL